MTSVIEYFRSVYEITLDESGARAALDFLVRYDIPFYGLRSEGATVSLRMYPPYFREYCARRRERRFAGETRRRLGFAALIRRHRDRAGLLIGGICALLLMLCSSLFVWDVTVTGNERISEHAMLEALASEGLYPGAFIPSLDTEKIEQRIALTVDGVSFFSINLRGTVAKTEMRERIVNTEIVDLQTPSNLVASSDGQIVAVEVTGGVAKVHAGQIVKRGEILASGIIDSAALGYRTVRARGNVTARVTRTHSVTVPLTDEQTVHTGVTHCTYTVKFFSKSLKLFGKDSIWDETCDRIEEERRIYLFGVIKLPIFITKTTYAEYETIPVTRTEDEALAEAKRRLLTWREAELADAEILSIQTETLCDGTALTLTQRIECITDIAREVPIGTDTAQGT
ncbi:MAG: sporulation protein YqfD [Clostridia bacterium]|nr:sporulation protein YqfD [Clostridia bacterium]